MPTPTRTSAAATRSLLAAALAGLALVPEMFLPWYGRSAAAGPGTPAGTAWEVFTKLDVILLVTAVLGAGSALVLAAIARRRGLPGWSLLGGAVVGGFGTIGAVLLLYRVIVVPGNADLVERRPGAIIGLVLITALAVAGWTATVIGARAISRGYRIILAPVVPPNRQLGPGQGDSPPGSDPGPPAPALPHVEA